MPEMFLIFRNVDITAEVIWLTVCFFLTKDINIRLKWPNDVYFGNKIKIGGVIVTSSATDNMLSAVMGKCCCVYLKVYFHW